MSKRKSRRPNTTAAPVKRPRSRIVALVVLMLMAVAAAVAAVNWSAIRATFSPAEPLPQATLPPLAVEYVHAGGRLVASESPSLIRLTGLAFGATPSSQSGTEYYKAVDGSTSSYFDYVNPGGGYAGIDLGTAKKVVKVRYYPRSGQAVRMLGGKFQGSNSQSTGYVDFYTIPTTPPSGQWTEAVVTDANLYRYVRYFSPSNGYCNVAEIEFYTEGSTIFSDVSTSDVFYADIRKIAARGVTLGCGSGTFCPDGIVTREQMAAFIIRALGVNPPLPGSQRFTDVPPTNGFYAHIEEMAVRQITLGCGSDTYCPTNNVTHDQMATFISRALGQFNPTPPPTATFADVPTNHYFFAFIEYYGAQQQIWPGCNGVAGPNFCPSNNVTRRQMAHILVRAFGANW